ncbi:MAG: GIY-YIG nuclease family protein [Thermovirgaceae bacterium]
MTGPCQNTSDPGLFYIYLLRCSDESYYCGIARDPQRRLRQHNEGRGARYTASRRPVELIYATSRGYSRAQAQVIERKAKMKPRDQKRSYLEATDVQEDRGTGG